VYPAALDPVLDCLLAQPELEKLPAGDDAVLRCSEPPGTTRPRVFTS